MDILKSATEWGKSELFSTPFFVLFGLVFIAAGLGFWQLGKTDLARAYIVPSLVAGTLLLIIGFGLYFGYKKSTSKFETAYNSDPAAFVASELERTEGTLKEYKNVVFTAIPIIIATCALILIFGKAPLLRASMITTIALLAVILLIDGLAHARIDNYNKHLRQAEQELKK